LKFIISNPDLKKVPIPKKTLFLYVVIVIRYMAEIPIYEKR